MRRTLRNALSCLALVAGALALTPAAQAHATSTSFLELEIPAGTAPLPVRWDLSVHDLIWSVYMDADFDGVLTWEELGAARASIERTAIGQLAISRGGEACALRLRDLALAKRLEQNYVSLAFVAQCPRAGLVGVGGGLFLGGDASQRVLLSATRGGDRLDGVLSPTSGTWQETLAPSAWGSFARFVGEGVWHVLIGYDHIAFILLLLLPAVLRPIDGRWQGATRLPQVARDIVTIVTAFTVAHSITLALAVTGTVVLPTKPIEIAIAASIAVAAAINLLPGLAALRLPLAFGFGLVHGFGFANVLVELEAPGTPLVPMLAGFNIGVELAQLGIVALVLPLIYLARGTRWYATGVMPLGSCALGAAGVVWLIQRL